MNIDNNLSGICAVCTKPLPSQGFYCGGCLTQFKCKSCDTYLESNNIGCINCGTPKDEKSRPNVNHNTFKLSETLTSRTIEATFSDNVGKELTGIIKDAYSTQHKFPNNENYLQIDNSTGNDVGNNNVTPKQVVEEVASLSYSSNAQGLENQQQDAVSKEWPALRGVAMRNLPNSDTEWIVVYAFYASKFGLETFDRENIIEKYKEANRFNKETTKRDLFSKISRAVNAGYINPLAAGYSILDKGIEKAKEIISRTSSSAPRNSKVKIKSQKTDDEQSSENIDRKGKKLSLSKPLKRLSNINFFPDGKTSLGDFFNKYTPSSDNERNLIFVYYLQEIIGISGITLDHIYTCYDALDLRISENLPQTIRNTKSKKGWIETEDTNNIRITVKGTNQIKQWNKEI
jgi:hypothetical protein